MQGTRDESRFMSLPAALAFIDAELGGVATMRAYNSALARAAAAALVAAWGTSTLLPRELAAPYVAVVETPLDFRYFLASSVAGTLPPGMTAARLSEAEAQALAAGDGGINERVAEAVRAAGRVQSMFFYWVVAGVGRIYCRISAQVYNTLDDYAVLADAVLAVAAACR